MAEAHNLAEWRGKDVLDNDGDKIGKLEDVYVDTESDEQLFGTVKEGFVSRHLTFVPLRDAEVTPGRPSGQRLQEAGEGGAEHRYRR